MKIVTATTGTTAFLVSSMLCCQAAQAQMIEEIVVTASKRSASVQDVPLSISAISGDSARALGWDTGAEALSQVPNVQLDSSGARSAPQFRIRGVGSDDFNVAGQSPVGVYINEVYINNSRARGIALYDIDRIEVLRGPQGTLWGKNTTAGAIHFVTKRPTFENDGYAQVKMGSVDGRGEQGGFEGAFGGALVGDVLAGRIAAKIEKGNDWINNEDPRGEDLGAFSSTSVRGSLLWEPTDELQATLIGTYTDYRGDPSPAHPFRNTPSIYGYTERPGIGYDTATESNTLTSQSKVSNVTFGLEWNVSDWTLNSITAFNGVKSLGRSDDDNSPVEGIFFQNAGKVEQLSQELRLTSSADKPLRWIFGAFGFSENLNSSYDLNFGLTPFDPTDPTRFSAAHIFGQEAPPAGAASLVVKSLEDRHRDSQALFASAEYDISENLTLAAGLRWTRDSEDIDLQLINYWLNHFGTLDFGNPATRLTSVLTVLDTQDKTKWNEPSGDATLKWAFSADANAYIRYAHGYRAGQYNITNTQPEDFSLVNPESINAYEIGLKTSLLDNRVQLNASVFKYDYSDIQVYIFTDAGSVALLNGDDATMRGGELEVNFAPVENLNLKGGLGYTDAKYGNFVSPVYDRTGNTIPGTPKWTWNLLAQYTIPLRSGAMVRLQTDWDHKDSFFADADNTPIGFTGGRTLGNASVSFEPGSQHWVIRGWIKNLTDELYHDGFGFHPVVNRVGYGMPRTFGLTLEWRLG
jgi:iron complex outermembrane recepter protein